jgi:hypothetical protein
METKWEDTLPADAPNLLQRAGTKRFRPLSVYFKFMRQRMRRSYFRQLSLLMAMGCLALLLLLILSF